MARTSMISWTGLARLISLDDPSQLVIYGKPKVLLLNYPPCPTNYVTEVIIQNIIERGGPIVKKYVDPTIGPPEPSFVLQLSDDVYTGSNLYAVQKMFEGKFQFDVFFESGSGKQKLSCKQMQLIRKYEMG
jgi:hypothetical protein